MSLQDYKKRTLEEQVLAEPDTFVGGTDEIEDTLPLYIDDKIVIQSCKHIPALLKLVDEILVNSRDQKIRLDECIKRGENDIIPVKEINFEYDKEMKQLSIYNDGNGIDVAKHPTEKDKYGNEIWIPDLILGFLLTSKNYNKSGKTTGGKNGFGAKLVNLFSQWFRVETVDHIRGLKYIQEYSKNMTEKTKPKITKVKCKPYTRISWIIDFNRFGIDDYSDDMVNLMKRRVYDIAGTTDKNLTLSYNGKKLGIKSFEKYTELYLNGDKKVYEKIHDRWDLCVSVSHSDKFENYSFVNGIYTSKGGKHVDMLTKQITSGISKQIKKKHKKDIPENYIKNYLKVFVNSVIEDPSFESQSKERLITSPSKFGSKPEVSEKFIKRIVDQLDIVDKVLSFADFKLNKESKKTDGNKKSKIRDIPKLDDANWAGTKKSEECILILTEGDSAKSMAVSGLSVVGRDKYGVFPLKGKVMNVMDASKEQILNNAEITNMKKILGLEAGKKYTNLKSLRYGKVMIMTDQDHDGSHIKGLVMNVFYSLWPELLELGYITSMITPIVKVTKGKQKKSFYTLTEYQEWREKTDMSTKWTPKYYKGLGTSTAVEAREYFSSLKLNNYIYTDETPQSMNLAFSKSEADNRKEWLYKYDENKILNHTDKDIPIQDFINHELIHFSNSDTLRSIGSVYDGLKPSQRKILYSCLKRNLVKEIRVAQLAGYVSENAAYHHGEASLQSAIIGMAQDYLGSNNINLLMPNGQFGTRIMGGKDSASPRYIHTELNKIVTIIYPPIDYPLLEYNDDDGVLVEPKYYIPIIPMVLVNGMNGIGTGFSTSIPKFNSRDVTENILRKIEGKPYKTIHPYYQGFKGEIIKIDAKNYVSKGKYEIINDSILDITELPIGKWTDDYKKFLDSFLVDDPKKKIDESKKNILDYQNNSTDKEVNFRIYVKKGFLKSLQWSEEKYIDGIEKYFKLTTTKGLSLTNIHLYDKGKIVKYHNLNTIFDTFYDERYQLYERRKEYQCNELYTQMKIIESKIQFIKDVINDKIVIYRQKKKDIISCLLKNQTLQSKEKRLIEEGDTNYCKDSEDDNIHNFDYLIKLSLVVFTEEEIEKLNKEFDKLKDQYETLMNKTIKEIWSSECSELLKHLKISQ